ncbi:MAG: diguanylate cyclase [Blautia sp.]|nr:diguanylate cyclase [Blautia sp.]
MKSASFAIYLGVIVLVVIASVYLAVKLVRKKKRGSSLLGASSFMVGMVNLFYFFSAFTKDYFLYSVLSSAFFICTDVMILVFLGFSITINRKVYTRSEEIVTYAATILVVLDSIQFILNIFKEYCLSYVPNGYLWPHYSYHMHAPYYLHMVLDYLMAVLALSFLRKRQLSVPKAYRKPYYYSEAAIIMAVVINAAFLFLPGNTWFSRIDSSTLSYAMAVFLVYWSFYEYSVSGMIDSFKLSVVDYSDRAVVFFSYDNELLLANKAAKLLFKSESLQEGTSISRFARKNNINIDMGLGINYSKQYYVEKENNIIPIRCDYQVIRDETQEMVGQMFFFTDVADETDLLTGFHNWDNFVQFAKKNPKQFDERMDVAVLDINALSVINHTFGRDEGDRKIRELAELMRKYLPKDTYFVRGADARLISITPSIGENRIRRAIHNIQTKFQGSIQYALNTYSGNQADIIRVIEEANIAVNTKKIQDSNSARSEVLATLVKALEEVDKDTKNHVQRTSLIGDKLGKRIGLSDIQHSQLSLLCLLHDIGKIGIPLEILNKPGKLTDEEWEIMRRHSEKGFQIANSSKELSMIAEMILYHHERWDGGGYPTGLSKESIPLLSRMISVIDAYDAMVQDRVYRKAMSGDAAIAELERCAGSQFDPHIVAEFVSMLREEGKSKSIYKTVENSYYASGSNNESKRSKEDIENIKVLGYTRYYLNEKYRIFQTDDEFELLTGYTKEEVQAESFTQMDLIPEADRVKYLTVLNEQTAANTILYMEHRLKKKNGDCIQVLCMGQVLRNEETGERRLLVIVSNIMRTLAVQNMIAAEQKKSQVRLRQWESQYRMDPLTGLMNRVAFKNDVDARLIAKQNRVLLLMFDIDKFKDYNDSNGHQKGDELLVLLGQTLIGLLGESDYACRLGGDEFSAAIIFEVSEKDDVLYNRAKQIYERLSAILHSSMEFMGVSMGAAVSSEKTATFEGLYVKADRMLYKAKEKGRNQMAYENE